MRKGWFLIGLPVILILLSIQAYSYLSESEKNRLEACPLKTYINVTGNGIYSIGCKDIVVEKGFYFIYVKTICDYYSISAFTNTDERSGGNSIKEGEIWKLHDFRAKANPYFLTCVINKTKLEDIKYIWVYIKTRSELEAETRGKELIKKLDVIINKEDVVINKSDETLKEINKTSRITSEINITTKQTNTTLTKAQESQNCKDKFGLLPEFLGLILGIIFVIIGLINKKNKKLQRIWWILAFIVIILVIIARISIVFYICKF